MLVAFLAVCMWQCSQDILWERACEPMNRQPVCSGARTRTHHKRAGRRPSIHSLPPPPSSNKHMSCITHHQAHTHNALADLLFLPFAQQTPQAKMSTATATATATTITTQRPDMSSTPASSDLSSAVQIRKLIDTIGCMGEAEHEQLLNILNTHGCRYTENSNGVFINLAHVPSACLHQMQQFARFWKDQNQHIHRSEQARMEIQQAMGSGGECPAGTETGASHTSETSDIVHRSAPNSNREQASCCQNETICIQNKSSTTSPLPSNMCDKTRKELDGAPASGATAHTTGNNKKGSVRSRAARKKNTTTTTTTTTKAVEENSVLNPSELSPEEETLIRAPVANKRRQLSLNRGGKQLLKRGGATSRVARTCIASEDNQHHEACNSVSPAAEASGVFGGE